MNKRDENSDENLAGSIGYFATLYDRVSVALVASINEATKVFDTFQKPLLRLGTDLNLIPDSIKSAAMELPVGIEDSLGVITEAFSSGMFALDKNTMTLAARMKATGESTETLFTSIKSLTTVFKSESGKLSESLLENSNTYHISTTSLIKTLNALSRRFEEIRPLADSKVVTDLTQELTGKVGSANEGLVERFLGDFLDPTAQSRAVANMLGIGDLQESLLSGGNVSSDEVLNRFDEAQKRYESLAKQGVFLQKEAANIFGDMGISLISINNAITSMDAIDSKLLEVQEDYSKSWSTFKDRTVKPILVGVTKAADWLLTIVNKLPTWLTLGVVAGLTKVLKGSALMGTIGKTLLGPALLPVLTALAPLIMWGSLLAGIAAGIYSIVNFFGKSKEDEERRANEAALKEETKIAKESTRFSTLVKEEMGAALRAVQLHGEKQTELLSALVDAVRDGTIEQIQTAKQLATERGYIRRAQLDG